VEPTESTRFLELLNALGVMFSDELSRPRQLLYWETFRDRITLEEWEYAASAAIQRETFHKVPLPAVLMQYVLEYRARQHQHQLDEERREREHARLLAQAERLAREASPEWQAEQAKKRAEEEQLAQEYQTWLQQQPRDVLIAVGKLNPPNPARWLPLDDEMIQGRTHKRMRRLLEKEDN
jgi:hypothetical protein